MSVERSQSLLLEATRRPVRAAYVVEPSHFTRETICSLTHHAHSKWGGRYHLIAPTDGATVAPAWLQMLRSLDPDCLFFVGDVSKATIDQLHETLYPAVMQRIEVDPSLPFAPVQSDLAQVHSIPRWIESRWLTRGGPQFVDFPAPDSRSEDLFDPAAREFCAINFGLADDSDAGQASLAGQDVTMGEYSRQNLATFGHFLLNSFGSSISRKARASVLARMPFTPQGLGNDFVFVIGSTPFDMAYAWNLDAFVGWDGTFGDPISRLAASGVMWVPTELARMGDIWDGAMLLAVKRPCLTGSVNRIRLCSTSESAEILAGIAATLSGKIRTEGVTIGEPEILAPNEPVFPTVASCATVARDWTHQVRFFEGCASVDLPTAQIAADPQFLGLWACDLALEQRLDDQVGYGDTPPVWRFPRRSLVESEMVFQGMEPTRVNADGLPVRIYDHHARSLRLALPTLDGLFKQLLCQRSLVREDLGVSLQPGPFGRIGPSPQGLHFEALLGLFGGFSAALSFLLQEPWARVFAEMIGKDATRKPFQHAQQVIVDHVEPAIKAGALTDETRLELAIAISQTPRAIGSEPTIASHRLLETIRAFGRDAFERQGDNVSKEQLQRWTFDQSWRIEYLLDRGVLFQGFEERCPECGLTQWLDKRLLASEPQCTGCRARIRVGTRGIEWVYKLNELVARAYRDRGLIATLAALRALNPMGIARYPFRVGLEFFRLGSKQAAAELDIAIVENTALITGEVKAHPMLFKEADMRAQVAVAREIQAASIFFAAPPQPAESWDWLAKLATTLHEESQVDGGPAVKVVALECGIWGV